MKRKFWKGSSFHHYVRWRNFLTRWGLSHYAREEPCLERMEPYVFLNSLQLGKTKEENLLEKSKEHLVSLQGLSKHVRVGVGFESGSLGLDGLPAIKC